MSKMYSRGTVLATAITGLLVSSFAAAESEQGQTSRVPSTQQMDRDQQSTQKQPDATQTARTNTETESEAMDSQKQVDAALEVVKRMKQDSQLTSLLQQAEGVFIVPKFGKAAAVVGGRGGEGVLLVKQNGEWAGPAFYTFGRVSAGLQAGAEAGSIAMLLMTREAVRPFTSKQNTFSLDAAAGITVVDYSAQRKSTAGEPDVITWSDSKGLFAGASIGVSGFTRDEDENRAYYLKQATPQQIFSGSVKNPHADALRESLPVRAASR